jgi:2-polyprenyl-3-methyl-5-hydroxy-6-metoxy-1,4-benzoquinol methylase
MSEYHKYIINANKREFIDAFEKMYQQESKGKFDSWHQEDSRNINNKITLSILDEWNFYTIIDIGSGKGALTHLLKKRNNKVLGLDIFSTAVEQAKAKFPDIQFESIDVNDSDSWHQYLCKKIESWGDRSCVYFRVSLLS